MNDMYRNGGHGDFSIDDLNEQPCCDTCGTPMTIEDYRRNNGFCQECINDRAE